MVIGIDIFTDNSHLLELAVEWFSDSELTQTWA